MFDFLKYKKTNFKAGGLLLDDTPLAKAEMDKLGIYKRAPKFIAPRRIDFRDMCLRSSNQGVSPHCAGYSTAGFIEVQNWRTKHYPEQVNGDAIYREAKKIDNFNGNGTYLWATVKAAANLGLTSGKGKGVGSNRQDIQFALHEFGVCLAGFIITSEWNSVDKKTGFIRDMAGNYETLGGHAVLLCGYDENGIYIQNSWGETWGLYGFAILRWAQYDRQISNAMVISP